MSGRQLFALGRPLLQAASLVFWLIPAPLCVILYELIVFSPWKLGIALRYVLAARLLGSCGANVAIHRGCVIRNWSGIHIGDNVQIHPFCYLDGSGGIRIGNDVSIAHASSLLSFEHTWADPTTPIKYNPLAFAEVRIHDDVWIGCGVRILSGVELQSRSVVAAGAVLTKGIHRPGLYGGVPARKLKDLT